jgi:hypothetical protein
VSERIAISPCAETCPWCDRPFEALTIGAHRKRFCSSPCRNAYHTALRKWAQREADQGAVTVADLKAVCWSCTTL